MGNKSSFFTINLDMLRESQIQFDLYVNASTLPNVDKYIKILKKGEFINKHDVDNYRKYPNIYLSEDERSDYIKYLVASDLVTDVQKADVLKDSAIVYLNKIFDPTKEFSTEILSETINQCKDAVENMIDVLGDYTIDSLKNLIGSLSFHDFYTFDHSINVSMYCMIILKTIKPNVSKRDLLNIGLGGLLHDLGKVKISTQILNKTKKLTTQEYEVIKTHPGIGITLILEEECQLSPDIDKEVLSRIIHEHHENINGTGYPRGLQDKQIHVYAKICAIADFFDAITTKRSYSEALDISTALGVMRKTSGIKIDSQLFEFFANHIEHKKLIDKDLKLSDEFDPAVCYEKLPFEELENALSPLEDSAQEELTINYGDFNTKGSKKKKSI